MLTDIRTRATKDTFFLVCDGLKGPPEVVGNVWTPDHRADLIMHLISKHLWLASKGFIPSWTTERVAESREPSCSQRSRG